MNHEGVSRRHRTPGPGAARGTPARQRIRWVRSSQYVTVRDGTRLAVDVFRPARRQTPVARPRPVLWTFTRYQRATRRAGQVEHLLDRSTWLQTLVCRGYVLAAVDVRGTGASFGHWDGPFADVEARDAYDLTEWFAAQPWCDGHVGMFGKSYAGATQYLAAGEAPPHLNAIFPGMACFDAYSFTYENGVFYDAFLADWNRRARYLDLGPDVARVDEDPCGVALHDALRQHRCNRDAYDLAVATPYRDDPDPATGAPLYPARSPGRCAEAISHAGIPVYHLAGWYDIWVQDALFWFHSLRCPQKILIGPWRHSLRTEFDLATEHLRWFDHWLRGQANGVMDEPPITYFTMNAPPERAWRSAWKWPLPGQRMTRYYVHTCHLGGSLRLQPPEQEVGADEYRVDYHATSGRCTRWSSGPGAPELQDDMSGNDRRGLAYTSEVLTESVEVTGHPRVSLWIGSTARDIDLFVYLAEVDSRERSVYVTEGALRASHRALAPSPYPALDLPYHRSHRSDLVELPAHPVELRLALRPTSYRFAAGSRIRVTVACADRDNALTPELDPPPLVTVFCNNRYPSFVELPIIPDEPAPELFRPTSSRGC